ncbi:MAG: hypothetical protein WB502_12240 [Thermoactinomyces sp.]
MLFVALFSGAGYLGFWLWRRYGPSLSPEVNAAIVGGTIAILSMIISSMMTYYATKRSERITVRDEMFRKRLEVYSTIHGILYSLTLTSHRYFRNGRVEEKEKIEKLVEEYTSYYNRNVFYLSKEVKRFGFTAHNVLLALVDFINQRDVNWLNHFLQEETMIKLLKDVKWFVPYYEVLVFRREVIPSSAISGAIQDYCLPVILQMNDELGFPLVEKEIHRLNEGE